MSYYRMYVSIVKWAGEQSYSDIQHNQHGDSDSCLLSQKGMAQAGCRPSLSIITISRIRYGMICMGKKKFSFPFTVFLQRTPAVHPYRLFRSVVCEVELTEKPVFVLIPCPA